MTILAEYIDHMGNDLRVVNAARVSFAKQRAALAADDERLLRYLARHEHWTPFAHCFITLRETVPIAIARQRFKHKQGFVADDEDFEMLFVENETSRRYVDAWPRFHVLNEWRLRPGVSMKQGSGGPHPNQGLLRVTARNLQDKLAAYYAEMLDDDVAPEQARFVLPQSTLTSYYVTGSLAAWARAYRLRNAHGAQREIADLAHQWNHHIAPRFPQAWAALLEAHE